MENIKRCLYGEFPSKILQGNDWEIFFQNKQIVNDLSSKYLLANNYHEISKCQFFYK